MRILALDTGYETSSRGKLGKPFWHARRFALWKFAPCLTNQITADPCVLYPGKQSQVKKYAIIEYLYCHGNTWNGSNIAFRRWQHHRTITTAGTNTQQFGTENTRTDWGIGERTLLRCKWPHPRGSGYSLHWSQGPAWERLDWCKRRSMEDRGQGNNQA